MKAALQKEGSHGPSEPEVKVPHKFSHVRFECRCATTVTAGAGLLLMVMHSAKNSQTSAGPCHYRDVRDAISNILSAACSSSWRRGDKYHAFPPAASA